MEEFLLVFRRDSVNEEPQASPAQLQALMKPWQDWIGNIAAQNKLEKPERPCNFAGAFFLMEERELIPHLFKTEYRKMNLQILLKQTLYSH
jgi:hypothetical protein